MYIVSYAFCFKVKPFFHFNDFEHIICAFVLLAFHIRYMYCQEMYNGIDTTYFHVVERGLSIFAGLTCRSSLELAWLRETISIIFFYHSHDKIHFYRFAEDL